MSKKILIVEDNAIVAMEIQEDLKSLGYDVVGISATGTEAIRQAADHKPDLILVDINLKGSLDGIKAAETIHSFLDVPVIYLTAYSDEETLKRAMKTGPFSYLIKPYETRELYSNIEMALYKDKMQKKINLEEFSLSDILKSIADPVIASDASGRIIFINLAAGVLIGMTQEEAQQKSVRELFSIRNEEMQHFFQDPQQQTKENLSPIETFLNTSEGKQIPVEVTTAFVQDNEHHVSGIVLVLRDMRKTSRSRTHSPGPG